MKKIFLLAIALLCVAALQAQMSKTKAKVTAHAKPTAQVSYGDKMEYVDFDIKTADAATTAMRCRLAGLLLYDLQRKSLTAYTNQDPSWEGNRNIFLKPESAHSINMRMRDSAVIDQIDKDGNKTGTKTLYNDFSPDQIMGYRLQQQVYTDKRTGAQKTNIIGLAPTTYIRLSNGDTIIAHHPICWFNYSQCRSVLLNKNSKANANKFNATSWDALFIGGKVKEL
jgi:hypothetical protein